MANPTCVEKKQAFSVNPESAVFFHENFILSSPPPLRPPPPEAGSSCRPGRPSSSSRPPRWPSVPSARAIIRRHSATASRWPDSSPSPAPSPWRPSSSSRLPAYERLTSTARRARGALSEEEEPSSAIQPAQVLQLVQVGGGESGEQAGTRSRRRLY